MNDEIKEILEQYLDSIISYPFQKKDKEYILDCITNLQQIEQDHQKLNGELREENQRLKETIENLTTMTVCGDRKQIKNTSQYKLETYKSRNEKALEYIKRFENQPWYVEGCQIKGLKSILQGDDKDVKD